jgi:hypothetical protein
VNFLSQNLCCILWDEVHFKWLHKQPESGLYGRTWKKYYASNICYLRTSALPCV